MAEMINDKSPATAQMLGEIWTYWSSRERAVHSAETDAFEYGNGVWFPNGGPLSALRAALPTWFPRVAEITHAHRIAQPVGDSGARPNSTIRRCAILINRYLRAAGAEEYH